MLQHPHPVNSHAQHHQPYRQDKPKLINIESFQ
jgi:hypothetical protein